MNEIQIKLGGKVRTLLFDLGTLKLISADTNGPLDPGNLVQVAADNLLKACYYGLLRSYKLLKKEPDFDLSTVDEWVDALSYQDGMAVLKVYNSAYEVRGESAPSNEVDADKKK